MRPPFNQTAYVDTGRFAKKETSAPGLLCWFYHIFFAGQTLSPFEYPIKRQMTRSVETAILYPIKGTKNRYTEQTRNPKTRRDEKGELSLWDK